MEPNNTIHGDFLTSPVISLLQCAPGNNQPAAPGTQTLGFTTAPTAADMGRKGGSSRTLDKRLAAQTNGKLDGRPRKSSRRCMLNTFQRLTKSFKQEHAQQHSFSTNI
jgi:hypothetical protein